MARFERMKQACVYRRYLFLLAMLLSGTTGMAQQTIIVKDSITQEAIQFASVYFGNESGGYTDKKGIITISDETDLIRFSHICYETKTISMSTISNHSILLSPKSISLDEVSVSAKPRKRIKTVEMGLMKTKTQTKHRGANGFEMALFIPYDNTWNEAPYIHSILASLDYPTNWHVFKEIKTPIYATLRLDLRQPDAVTGAPKEKSIIGGGIIIPSTQKIDKDGISLPHPIPFPQSGVFVVIEWITTAQVSESCNLVPSLNMTLNESNNRTWNKKTFRGMDWMREQDEPIYKNGVTQGLYKGRTPSAKLGLKISNGH